MSIIIRKDGFYVRKNLIEDERLIPVNEILPYTRALVDRVDKGVTFGDMLSHLCKYNLLIFEDDMDIKKSILGVVNKNKNNIGEISNFVFCKKVTNFSNYYDGNVKLNVFYAVEHDCIDLTKRGHVIEPNEKLNRLFSYGFEIKEKIINPIEYSISLSTITLHEVVHAILNSI